MKKLSVIIVNYNVCHFLEQALHSVKTAIENIDAEVFVVDNNSVDGSVEMVNRKFPFVRVIANKENTGFSKANNQAILQSNAEYILLLNPDTIVEKDTFEKCIHFMDAHLDAGGLGVKMLDGSGKFLPESKRGLPTPAVAFYKIFGLSALFPKSKKFGKYHLGYLNENEINPVTVLSGAFMFLRKSTLDKVGLLDEAFFMYGEDIDLSYRIIKGGYKNYYFPETRIIHYKGESTKKTSVNYVFVFYKAMILFARKHFTEKNAGLFSFLINFAIYLRAGMALLARFISKAITPIADAALIYGGMFAMGKFWETSFKNEPGSFPTTYYYWVIPSYILIWVFTVFINSGYAPIFRFRRIARGVFTGSIIISILSNFIDQYRFSKALIIFGSIYSMFAMLFVRLAIHFIKNKNFNIGVIRKQIVVVGNKDESQRVIQLLNENNYQMDIVGYCSPANELEPGDFYLGNLSKLKAIIGIYKVDEIIFCSKDIPTHYIIECMSGVYNRAVDYKIVAEDSDFIIGSNSKNTKGEFYTLSIQLNIIKEENIRSKRMIDVVVGIFLLLMAPLVMWYTRKPFQFVKNIFHVLWGKYSWVGFTHGLTIKLPDLKRGIISPVNEQDEKDVSKIAKLNFIYARDYNPYVDLKLIFNAFRRLGSTL